LLLSELPRMPIQRLHLPISTEPRVQRIAAALADDPSIAARWPNGPTEWRSARAASRV
jgi:hypothetical protein